MADPRTPPHTLIVEQTDDGLRYRIDCDGVTDWCRLFEECLQTGCNQDALEEAQFEGEQHGAVHAYTNLGWSVRTDRCWLAEYPDNRDEAARDLDLPPGTYRVVHETECGGEYFTLEALGG